MKTCKELKKVCFNAYNKPNNPYIGKIDDINDCTLHTSKFCFSIGTGDPSDILNTRTKGSKPVIPEAGRFIEVSTNSITLHLSAWSDGGCPMLYFVVEHKKK